MRKSIVLVAVSALALSGCGTYSFGPPEVSLSRRTPDQDVSQTCLVPAGGAEISHNVDGALALIDNFIGSYRCTMRIAADGRQAWQLPAFLALVSSTTAVALGGGTDWAIAGGAANSIFNAGNAYYNPAEQAEILRDAIEALTCIQTEAVGVEAFARAPATANAPAEAKKDAAETALAAATARVHAAEGAIDLADARMTELANRTSRLQAEAGALIAEDATDPERAPRLADAREAIERLETEASAARIDMRRAENERLRALQVVAAERAALAAAQAEAATLGEIEISAEEQYFNMVSAALLSVEVAAAQRLSRRGSYDVAGVVAQIEALAKKVQDAQAEANAGGAETPSDDDTTGEGDQRTAMANLFADPAVRNLVTQIRLQLNVMRPKLQQCILRAQA